MNTQHYKLVNNSCDKVIAFIKWFAVELFGLIIAWFLIKNRQSPEVNDLFYVWLGACALIVFVCGPLVLIDALTARICITDRGISITSAIKQVDSPWISWDELTSVRLQECSARVAHIKKVVISGQHEIVGIGGSYWRTRKIVIPGHQPEIQKILQSLRELVPDKF